MKKEFIRVRSVKDIIISLTILIGGCILVALPTSDSVNIAGFFLILAGLLLFFIMKTSYKDASNGEKYAKKERFFSNDKREHLKKTLTSPASFCAEGEDKGNALRLDVYYNKNRIYIQMFEYVPYKYEPCSPVFEHDASVGTTLLK